jgi:glyoxylase-like metal-dependent hydrolase (beta-lactamase superfamily II)
MLLGDPEPVGADAWVMRGGLPRHGINVFFIREGDRVACFDAGAREMGGEIQRTGERFGGISRVVLSHSHFDHRGGTRGVRAPIYCHPAERADVEGDAGFRYWGHFRGENPALVLRARVMTRLRDSGPVEVAGTVNEGDPVGAYRVLHLPGHAPGQIVLWREDERTIIASDCFYTLDEQTASLSHTTFSDDPEQAAASLRQIAELEPSLAWPAHGPALRGDVRGVLERALAAAGH